MTIPQLQAMPAGDKARKMNLVNYGFRLPSALDHRPLAFAELENKLSRKDHTGKIKKTDLKILELWNTYKHLQERIVKDLK